MTNKQDAPGQIASRYCRESHFGPPESHNSTVSPAHAFGCDDPDDSPELHHSITNSRNNPTPLAAFTNTPDPAKKVNLDAPFPE